MDYEGARGTRDWKRTRSENDGQHGLRASFATACAEEARINSKGARGVGNRTRGRGENAHGAQEGDGGLGYLEES